MRIRYKSPTASGDLFTGEIRDPWEFFARFDSIPVPESAEVSIRPDTKREAHGLLGMLASHLRHSTPIPGALAEWFYSAVDEASWHDKDYVVALTKALGLVQQGRGRPSKAHSRDPELFLRMQALIDSGRTILDARGQCAEEFGIDESNVEKIYYAFRRFAELKPF